MQKPMILVKPVNYSGLSDRHLTYIYLVANRSSRHIESYSRIRDARRGAKRLQAALGGPRIISITEV